MVSMSAVWDRTTEFLSDNLAGVTPIAVGALFLPVSLKGNLQPLAATATDGPRLAIAAIGLLLSIIILWGSLVLIAMAADAARTDRDARALAMRRLPMAVLVWLILLVILVVLVLPFLFILSAYHVDVAGMANGVRQPLPDGIALPLIVCGVIILPLALWIWARFASVLLPVVVAEQRGMAAFSRSFALTGGLALRIIGVFILYFAVSQVASLATKTVFGSVLRLLDSGDGAVSLAGVLTAVAVGVVETIFSVLIAVFTAKLYVALRAAREGDPAA